MTAHTIVRGTQPHLAEGFCLHMLRINSRASKQSLPLSAWLHPIRLPGTYSNHNDSRKTRSYKTAFFGCSSTPAGCREARKFLSGRQCSLVQRQDGASRIAGCRISKMLEPTQTLTATFLSVKAELILTYKVIIG